MKIMTLSISPYVCTSEGKMHAEILQHLFSQGHAVASIAWAHDTSFFIPEEVDGVKKHYYEFELQNQKCKIPVIPFQRNNNDVVMVYEILQQYKPDVIITIGDYNDFFYMKAVKQFYSDDLKWLFILNNYSYPINENDRDLINYADGVLCTSQFCYDIVKDLYVKDLIEVQYVGCDHKIFNTNNRQPAPKDKFRIMVNGKNLQIENVPMVMQAVAELRASKPELELYVLSNLYDNGDYDLELLKNRFDPNSEFISFPDKYVSIIDGLSPEEVALQLKATDLFISVPMVSSSSMCVFEAISCGCVPLMSDCGSNANIAKMLEELHIWKRNSTLVPCIELLTRRENYLNVTDPSRLKQAILRISENIVNNEGTRKGLSEFIRNYDRADFVKKVSELTDHMKNSKSVICLETV